MTDTYRILATAPPFGFVALCGVAAFFALCAAFECAAAQRRIRRRIAALREERRRAGSELVAPPAQPAAVAPAAASATPISVRARGPRPKTIVIYSPRLRAWVPLLGDERAAELIGKIFAEDEGA
jgi:hypothetical protein